MLYKFIVAGGGTSGHINPALTIAGALKKFYEESGDEVAITFVGRENSLESELVSKAGYSMTYVEAKPFPMKPSKKMIDAVKALSNGTKTASKLIEEFKPNAVIGTGGYVCAPLFRAAKKHKVPVIIHESNAFPGRLNRLSGRSASLVLTGFPNLEKVFSKAKKVVYTGNPVRDIMFNNDYKEARAKLGIDDDTKLIFAMGGSLGAKTINDFMIECAARPEYKDVKFVLGSGKQQSSKLNEEKKEIPENLTIMEYIDNPNVYLAGADISITRAGAVTCAEIAAIGACNVFIPYPFAAQDHQTFNASAFSNTEAGVLVPDAEVKTGLLLPVIAELLEDDERRKNIRINARKLSVEDCDRRIVTAIDDLIKGKN